jgi:hypothetical protein
VSDNFDDIIREAMKMPRKSGSMFDTAPGVAEGLVAPGNINIHRRPVVKNPDGSISTVRSMSFTDDDGRNILIPTVVGDRVLPDKEAIAHYYKSGEHLGMFQTPEHADLYAQSLHEQQEGEYK